MFISAGWAVESSCHGVARQQSPFAALTGSLQSTHRIAIGLSLVLLANLVK